MSLIKYPVNTIVLLTCLLIAFLYAFPIGKSEGNSTPKAPPTKNELVDRFRVAVSKELPLTQFNVEDGAAKQIEFIIQRAADTVIRENASEEDVKLAEQDLAGLAVKIRDHINEKRNKTLKISGVNFCKNIPGFPLCPGKTPQNSNQTTNINQGRNTNSNGNTDDNSNTAGNSNVNNNSNVNTNTNVNANSYSGSKTLFRNNYLKNGMISSFVSAPVDGELNTDVTFERVKVDEKDIENAVNLFGCPWYPFC